jgi:hypothetical protein
MLVGAELLALVNARRELNQSDLAEAAGYVRTTKTGRKQVMVKRFINALLTAQGLPIPAGRTPGKCAQYETTVHRSGVVLLGKTYTEKFGLQPGDSLVIQLTDDCIQLVPKPVLHLDQAVREG